MQPRDFFQQTITVLESLKVPYLVTGSVASITYGEPRFTADTDFVVRMGEHQARKICEAFDTDEFYVSLESALEAVHCSSQFNIIQSRTGFKIDLMLSTDNAYDDSRFARGQRIQFAPGFFAVTASPEDVIIKKLEYYKLGGSDKHLRDIAGILRVTGDEVDRDSIGRWVARLGLEIEREIALARADN